jgi:cell wall-associated NlpC family hydrolase
MGSDYKISSDRFVADDDVVVGTYYPGDKGDEISKLQQALKDLEYYDYSSITGYYGPVTETAVTRFQKTNGLTQDGIAGLETVNLIYSGNAKYFCIYPGDRGADVENLQIRLKELGYYTYDTITGYFGKITTDALIAFQKQNGLTADGKAGKNTRALLYSSSAKANDSSQQSAPSDEQDTTDQTSQSSTTEKMLAFANEQLGKKYVYSTEGPNSFDCSGFVYYVLKYMGVSTSRYSSSGFSKVESWELVERADLQPGDLLFYKSDTSSSISHTGIYLGNGTFIHASTSGGCVKISDMSGYYDRNFVLARRVFN